MGLISLYKCPRCWESDCQCGQRQPAERIVRVVIERPARIPRQKRRRARKTRWKQRNPVKLTRDELRFVLASVRARP